MNQQIRNKSLCKPVLKGAYYGMPQSIRSFVRFHFFFNNYVKDRTRQNHWFFLKQRTGFTNDFQIKSSRFNGRCFERLILYRNIFHNCVCCDRCILGKLSSYILLLLSIISLSYLEPFRNSILFMKKKKNDEKKNDEKKPQKLLPIVFKGR